nr:unnamed protein product [Spirometra erinaceieuropaei]
MYGRRQLPTGNRPKRTALISRELAHYKVDIVDLGESLFSEQGQSKVGAGYTFWSACTKAEQRDANVVLAIRSYCLLNLSGHCHDFSYQLAQHLEDLQALHDNFTVETVVATVEGYRLRSAEVLGRTCCQHQDWFDEDDADIIRQRLREMQDAGMVCKTEEIQCHTDRNDMKNFYVTIKEFYDLRAKETAPLLGSERTTFLTEKSQMLKG